MMIDKNGANKADSSLYIVRTAFINCFERWNPIRVSVSLSLSFHNQQQPHTRVS